MTEDDATRQAEEIAAYAGNISATYSGLVKRIRAALLASPVPPPSADARAKLEQAAVAEQSEDTDVVNAVTAAMREADRVFEKVGGSTRHHVRDCLLPVLNRAGWVVVRNAPYSNCRLCHEPLRRIDGVWLDAETHSTCEDGRKHEAFAALPPHEGETPQPEAVEALATEIHADLGNYNAARGSEVSPPFIERIKPILARALAHRASPLETPQPAAEPSGWREEAVRQIQLLETDVFGQPIDRNVLAIPAPRRPDEAGGTAMNENWPDQAFKPAANLADAAEMLWIVLANVSGGDWSKQSKDWQEAAARWRDEYFRIIKADSLPSPVPPVEGKAR